MSKLLYEEITYNIRGACYNVYNELKGVSKEKVVERALEIELLKRKMSIDRQKKIDIFYQEKKVGIFIPDFVVENKVIVEIKAKEFITKYDIDQLWNYLKSSAHKVGLLVNFGHSGLDIKRIVYDTARSMNKPNQSAKIRENPRKSALAGFTLIETLIYVAIIGAVVTSFISFGMTISSARNKNYAIQEVQANTRIAINIVQQKIREASGINIGASTFGSDPGVLSLSMTDAGKNPTIISLNQDDGQLQITEGVNPPIFLTSGKVKMTNLIFNNLTPLHGKGNIGIELKTEYNITNADKSFQYEKSIRTAENLR